MDADQPTSRVRRAAKDMCKPLKAREDTSFPTRLDISEKPVFVVGRKRGGWWAGGCHLERCWSRF